MSRPLLILLIILVSLVLAAIGLASIDTETAPTTVRKAMLNEAQPR